jgi:hypothetical protein
VKLGEAQGGWFGLLRGRAAASGLFYGAPAPPASAPAPFGVLDRLFLHGYAPTISHSSNLPMVFLLPLGGRPKQFQAHPPKGENQTVQSPFKEQFLFKFYLIMFFHIGATRSDILKSGFHIVTATMMVMKYRQKLPNAFSQHGHNDRNDTWPLSAWGVWHQ